MSAVDFDFRSESRVAALESRMREHRHGFLRTRLHRILRRKFSDFDVNAWLGMYPMTLLTNEEWKTVLPNARGRALDIGAGSGDLTRALTPLFDEVACTETSAGMSRKLRKLGYKTHHLDLSHARLPTDEKFDFVFLLHVLDRCAMPRALFRSALTYARAGATVVVAVPLPYDPIVDVGGSTLEPEERVVPLSITDVAEAKSHIEQTLFRDEGLRVHAVARAPYLCPGDAAAPFYSLDSFIFVATKPA